MTSRRSVIAEAPIDQQRVAIGGDGGQRAGQGVRLVRDALFAHDARAGRLQTVFQDAQRLGDDAGFQPRQQGRDDADAQRTKGGDAHRVLSRRRERSLERVARHGEGNDLDGRHHIARRDGAKRRQRGGGDRLVDSIDAGDFRGVDDDQAGFRGEKIDAAGEGALRAQIGPRQADGEAPRRFILADIAGIEARRDDLSDARRLERGLMFGSDELALFQNQPIAANRMRDDRAERLSDGNRTEFQAACPSARIGFLRKAATISPMIETAISAGLTAPMSRPIGACMRASAASPKPCARIRSSRLAWVLREPSAPM